MVGVVAHQGRHVERGRQPGLAVVEQELEPPVGVLRGAEPREHPHGPRLAAVHRGVRAAGVGVLAGVAQVALVAPAARGEVVGAVGRLQRDPAHRAGFVGGRPPTGAAIAASGFFTGAMSSGVPREPPARSAAPRSHRQDRSRAVQRPGGASPHRGMAHRRRCGRPATQARCCKAVAARTGRRSATRAHLPIGRTKNGLLLDLPVVLHGGSEPPPRPAVPRDPRARGSPDSIRAGTRRRACRRSPRPVA